MLLRPPLNRYSLLPVALSALTATLLTACTPVVNVLPAEDAANPACAEVMVGLPIDVADHSRRETNSQATSAWGSPSKVVLRCGVEPPGPTTDECASVNGVDWVLREGEKSWTATTYGRNPAVEVLFDPEQVASSTVLVELGAAVSVIGQDRECLGRQDTLELPAP